jgi:hypothetical protein
MHEPLERELAQELEQHLAGCAACRDLGLELEALADLLEAHGRRVPHPARLEQVWTRLAPELDRVDAARSAGAAPADGRPAPRPAATRRRAGAGLLPARWRPVLQLAAAAALLLVGFGAGLWIGGTDEPPRDRLQARADGQDPALPSPASSDAAGTSVDADLRSYLESARPLLLAIVNRRTEDAAAAGLDLSLERRTAQRLAGRAGPLVERLGAERRRRERDLVAELELVLLQLANLSEHEQAAALTTIQEMLANRSLLIQVELATSQADRRTRT